MTTSDAAGRDHRADALRHLAPGGLARQRSPAPGAAAFRVSREHVGQNPTPRRTKTLAAVPRDHAGVTRTPQSTNHRVTCGMSDAPSGVGQAEMQPAASSRRERLGRHEKRVVLPCADLRYPARAARLPAEGAHDPSGSRRRFDDRAGAAGSSFRRFGSLRPWPSGRTRSSRRGRSPAAASLQTPPGSPPMRLAEDALARARSRYAATISSSVTVSMSRPTRRARPRPASRSRIADADGRAIVSGCSTGWPSTIGAAPAAWKPYIFGRESIRPRPGISRTRPSRP